MLGWLEYSVLTLSFCSYVKSTIVQKKLSRNPLSLSTFHKCIKAKIKPIETELRDEHPNKFGLVIDGCIASGTYFAGLFACFSAIEQLEHMRVLLGFSPFVDEIHVGAGEYVGLV